MNYKLAIDLGGTSAKCVLFDEDCHRVARWSVPTNIDDKSVILSHIFTSIQEHLAEHSVEMQQLVGIGMGSPGFVDPVDKTVTGAFNLGWEYERIGEQFEAVFPGVPFFIDNDANVAALGEQIEGAGRGASDIIMVTLGTGVGGGIVANNQLVNGMGGAGEIGHMRVQTHQPMHCTCGKLGCLEAVASATGIVNLAKRAFEQVDESDSSLYQTIKAGDFINAQTVIDAAKANDGFALEIYEEFIHYLAFGLSNLINILNPEKIILGGGVSNAGEFLLKDLKAAIVDDVYRPLRQTTEIVLAELGNDAGIIGARELIH